MSHDIPFTQYLRPDGRRVPVEISVSAGIYALARRVIDAGGCFEVEHLRGNYAWLTAAYRDHDIAIRVVKNGPEVPPAVDALVIEAATRLGIIGRE